MLGLTYRDVVCIALRRVAAGRRGDVVGCVTRLFRDK